MPIVPHRFLCRFSFPVRQLVRLPKKGSKLLGLPKECALPDLSELDESPSFGEIRVAWNRDGIGFSVSVADKKHPPQATLDTPTDSDGLQVWIDTRNTQSIHRASRFCHHFCFLPTGGGPNKKAPAAVQLPIARARDDVSMADPERIAVAIEKSKNGYQLEAWLPADVLTGFDPDANPFLGFYYYLRDAEHGEQFLSVGREFPFDHDPSLWSTLELVD